MKPASRACGRDDMEWESGLSRSSQSTSRGGRLPDAPEGESRQLLSKALSMRVHIYIIALLLLWALAGYVFFVRP
jgi:hypothetical protein